MPHITIEYTDNLAETPDFQHLFSQLINALDSTGSVRINGVMARSIKLTDWRVGDGDSNHAFVHLKMATLDTRPPEFKQQVLALFNPIMKSAFARTLQEQDCQICVEIQDIRTEFYDKFSAL